MRSATRSALTSTQAVLAELGSSADLASGAEILAAGRVVAGAPQLLTLLADPTADVVGKKSVVDRVFAGQSDATRAVLTAVAGSRWSSQQDLLAGIEDAGIRAVAATAGSGSSIEAELFAFETAVRSDAGLELALGTKLGSPEQKSALVERLIGSKSSPQTVTILSALVQQPRGRRIGELVRDASRIVADQAEKVVATVITAAALTDSAGGSRRPRVCRCGTARTSSSTTSSTPRSSAGSGCRSAATSSTAPCPRASLTSGSSSPAERTVDPDTQVHNGNCPHRAASPSRSRRAPETNKENPMADITISPDEIRDALKDFVSNYEPTKASTAEIGHVTDAGDGIAHVEGLPGVMANELIRFADGTLGLAQNLDEDSIGAIVLGEFSGVEEGQEVTRTGEVLSAPVGDAFLGRVVDPLGAPIDGLGEIAAEGRRALELQAPGVMSRKSVHEPLQTGIKAIDAMIPVGRGQRQLIIGDRQTGKTAIAIDTIINQKANWDSGDENKQVRCIYVAIGQKGSTIASVKGALEDAGAMEYTTIVAAPASDPAGFKYLAPYTGSAIGQHWMYQGKHVLIIFDDLSKQAEAYRAVSLLLRRPPGREAYPGDVFYLHSRLLERCAKLNDELGAGSMTGLPIIETKANDVSAYIPTNVISITDGQIFLQSDLFNANQRPAVDVGISVSRVGGDAQVKSIKKVSGTLKLELAQYRSLEAFAMFASDLDQASRRQLDRGARLTELLKQPQYSPYPVEEQVVSIWAGTNGKLDTVPVPDVLRFESELLDHLRRNSDVLTTLRETNQLSDDTVAEMDRQIDEFTKSFQTSDGKTLGSEQVQAADAEDVDQEQIVKGRR